MSDQKKSCCYCEIQRFVVSELGADRRTWPVPGAIIIPVEMIESWLLLMCDAKTYDSEQKLPIFAVSESASARHYYSSNKVPSQLKDLIRQEKKKLCLSDRREFYRICVERANVDLIATKSPSFAQFVEQVKDW